MTFDTILKNQSIEKVHDILLSTITLTFLHLHYYIELLFNTAIQFFKAIFDNNSKSHYR